MMDPRLK